MQKLYTYFIHSPPHFHSQNHLFFLQSDKSTNKTRVRAHNNSLLRMYWRSHLFVLLLSFDYTEMPSPHRSSAEPSLSQRRKLGKSMPNLRQLVESKRTPQ